MKIRNIIVTLSLLLTAMTGGCRQGPSAAEITFHVADAGQFHNLNRVVVAELEPVDTPVHYVRQMSIALSKSVQSRRLFHVDLLERSEPVCRDLPLHGGEALSMSQMSEIRKTLNCDGIILGQVRHFRPYPHMQVGMFVKMIDLKNGRCLWAVDHVWETADKETEHRIRSYFNRRMRSGYEPMDWQVATISPKVFTRFVTYEVASTLPAQGAEVGKK